MSSKNCKYVSITLVCVLAASFADPYAFAQQTPYPIIGSKSLFVTDQASVKLVKLQPTFPPTAVTRNFTTDAINGPRGIIFTNDRSPVMLVANQFPNTPFNGDVAKYDPSNGNYLGPLVSQTDPNAPQSPRGIVLSPNHKVLYVADLSESTPQSPNGPGKLLTYNANTGAFIAGYSAQSLLQQFKDPSTHMGDQFNPRGIVFGPNGLLYISVFDTNNPLTGYILTFNPSTSKFNILVRSDDANNHASGLHRPEGIVFDSSGNLWVTSFCAVDSSTGECSNTYPTPATSSTNVDKVMEFDHFGNLIKIIPLESSTEVPRTYSQAILFGPYLGNGNLYVPIQTTGELRVCDTIHQTCSSISQSGDKLAQPWYLSFRYTDPSTLDYHPTVASVLSSIIKDLGLEGLLKTPFRNSLFDNGIANLDLSNSLNY